MRAMFKKETELSIRDIEGSYTIPHIQSDRDLRVAFDFSAIRELTRFSVPKSWKSTAWSPNSACVRGRIFSRRF